MLMREYETLYILKPDLADDLVAKVNERLTGVLDREGGKVLRLDIWGKKKLAYEVKKNPKGLYVHLSYLGQPQVVSEFERNLRMIEPVVKYQTIKIAEGVDVDSRMAQAEADNRARAAAEAQRKAELEARGLSAEPAPSEDEGWSARPPEAREKEAEGAEEDRGRGGHRSRDEFEEE